VRDTRSLSNIYQRRMLQYVNLLTMRKLSMTSCGKRVMKEELYMIEKNNTLIDIPLDRKVIVVYDGSIKQSLLGILILIRVVPWKI